MRQAHTMTKAGALGDNIASKIYVPNFVEACVSDPENDQITVEIKA